MALKVSAFWEANLRFAASSNLEARKKLNVMNVANISQEDLFWSIKKLFIEGRRNLVEASLAGSKLNVMNVGNISQR